MAGLVMGALTAIGWTDHTFNPWWGCERVSPGCQHCYAEAFAKRTGHAVWGKTADRRFFGDKHWAEPLKWNAAAEKAGVRARVFCASMADVFEDRPELVEHRSRLFDLVARTPWLTWQILTKRPQNVARMVPICWDQPQCHSGWPANVWIGTTAEDQQRADERIPQLLTLAAPVRFLSCEPLLSGVSLRRWLPIVPSIDYGNPDRQGPCWWTRDPAAPVSGIGWVIAGGESGPGHRLMMGGWARELRDQCRAAGVPFFFKQWGGRTPTAGGDQLDGETWKQFP